MVDDLDEKSEGFDLQRYLGVVRRRHLQFLIPLFVGWIVVWGVSWVLPPRYLSTTLILVEQPTMPKDYVTPNVNDDLQQRMQSITQQILSRTRLLRIIDQFDLYAGDALPAITRPEGRDHAERHRHRSGTDGTTRSPHSMSPTRRVIPGLPKRSRAN